MKKVKPLLIIILASTLYFSQFKFVHAQAVIPLTVSPTRSELNLDAGEKTAVTVKFFNKGDTPVSGLVRVADFIVDDADGTPRIIDNPDQGSPKYSAASWFFLPFDRMTIPANEVVSFQVQISVPPNARPGGRYTAVYFEPAAEAPASAGAPQEAGVGIAPRLASLVYIRISGDTVENAMISRMFSKNFQEYGPIKLEVDLLNRGDYHIRPKGVITLINPFGAVTEQVKLTEVNVFPDSQRTLEASFGPKWMVGRYKVDLSASYGDQGKALNRFIYVWVFPWRLVLIVILTLVIVWLIMKNALRKSDIRNLKLEHELEEEKEEIEQLKTRLKKRGD